MGAGVLSLIGISLSILPILLFLILLAVYDAISVYKTKHMLTLAESVVESKLPILLVFPQKMGYKYEEEKDLMDKSRPREALFMGLGDVIIPGTLVVSASTFLAGRDGLDILGVQPQYIVVITSLIGLLIGYSALMYFVLKGKPQAGLPLLNSGTIIGFLIGELIAFGTLIIV
jgi:presenilin-like A22 family membrane protease